MASLPSSHSTQSVVYLLNPILTKGRVERVKGLKTKQANAKANHEALLAESSKVAPQL